VTGGGGVDPFASFKRFTWFAVSASSGTPKAGCGAKKVASPLAWLRLLG